MKFEVTIQTGADDTEIREFEADRFAEYDGRWLCFYRDRVRSEGEPIEVFRVQLGAVLVVSLLDNE